MLIHFSETSGNLGFWLTLYERLDPKSPLFFNAIGRQVAAYTFLEFFKIGFLWYEIQAWSKNQVNLETSKPIISFFGWTEIVLKECIYISMA